MIEGQKGGDKMAIKKWINCFAGYSCITSTFRCKFSIHLLFLHFLIPFILSLLPVKNIHAQYFTSEIYPKNYFTSPLNIPLQLSGNFGEIRKEHFHMGIDLRTNQKENLPVFAAASGYVSRIKIERYGYGRAIYITHPNGYTTLYAHLNNFFDTLHNYVKNKQYTEQQWEQDFTLDPGLFTVNQGQFIAFSGNTGGSQGPHLHFEIRDEKGNNVNPLLFNFSIVDNITPSIEKLYWYNNNSSIYNTTPIEIPLVKNKTEVTIKDSIVVVNTNRISFGISAKDGTNTSAFRFGIYAAEVWVDSSMQFGFKLNKFSYNDTRYINACIDYTSKYNNGKNIYLLKQLPGNQLSIFGKTAGNGEIFLADTLPKPIEILVKDIAGNDVALQFLIQYKPDSIKAEYIKPPITHVVLNPNQRQEVMANTTNFNFTQPAFYDTVYFNTQQLSYNASFPVHNKYNIAIPIATLGLRNIDKLMLVSYNKWFREAQKPTIKNDTAFGVLDFLGTTILVEDTTAPIIKPINFTHNATLNKAKEIILEVKDAVSDIKFYKAFLDSSWILMSRKNNLLLYEIDERCPLGNHILTIVASDMAGNETTETFNFTTEDKPINKKKKKLLSKKSIRKKKKKR